MKKFYYKLFILSFLTVFIFNTCTIEKEKDRYSFWRGDLDNYYYILDANDKPLHKVVGKPFMVMEYDPMTGYPIRLEFGLYQARNEYLDGAEGIIPEPFMSASALNYSKKLGITGSVSILCNWCQVTSTNKLPGGDFEFWIDKGKNFFGHEVLYFTYTSPTGLMDGEIRNSEDATWGARVSEQKAFKLQWRFNSSSLD